ncbi:hypothetical protein SDC9_135241 [bioreactor metagenome]|uniref:Uncharacterized protein n=1 Tax=bioreactor metagenome TaxID=1076179 RepID=A0A645DF79_9ZZZZ
MSYQPTNDCIRFSTQGSLEKCVSFFEDTINKGKGELYGIIIDAIGQGSVVVSLHADLERPIGGDPVVSITYLDKEKKMFHLLVSWKSDIWEVKRVLANLLPSVMMAPGFDENRQPYPDDRR